MKLMHVRGTNLLPCPPDWRPSSLHSSVLYPVCGIRGNMQVRETSLAAALEEPMCPCVSSLVGASAVV